MASNKIVLRNLALTLNFQMLDIYQKTSLTLRKTILKSLIFYLIDRHDQENTRELILRNFKFYFEDY